MSSKPPTFKSAVQRLEELGGRVFTSGTIWVARLHKGDGDWEQGVGPSAEVAAKNLLDKLDNR